MTKATTPSLTWDPGRWKTGPGSCLGPHRDWAWPMDTVDQSGPEVLLGRLRRASDGGRGWGLHSEACEAAALPQGWELRERHGRAGQVPVSSGKALRKGDAEPASCPVPLSQHPQQTIGCPVARWVWASPALPKAGSAGEG